MKLRDYSAPIGGFTNKKVGQIPKVQLLLMEPYMVYIESDLEKMILDIIKFDIMKEIGVTELLFFNEFQPNTYLLSMI